MTQTTQIKIGDKVKIKDGSYAIRVDYYVDPNRPSNGIGLCEDTFEVIGEAANNLTSSIGAKVHDIFIRNLATGATYLHSAAFVLKLRLKVKPAVRLMQALIDAGYKVDVNGDWHLPGKVPFTSHMWRYCGQTLSDDYAWNPDWLEEV